MWTLESRRLQEKKRAGAWRSSRRPAPSRYTSIQLRTGRTITIQRYTRKFNQRNLMMLRQQSARGTTRASRRGTRVILHKCASPRGKNRYVSLVSIILKIIPPHDTRDGQANCSSTKLAGCGAEKDTAATSPNFIIVSAELDWRTQYIMMKGVQDLRGCGAHGRQAIRSVARGSRGMGYHVHELSRMWENFQTYTA